MSSAIVYNPQKLNRKVLFKGCEFGYNTYPTDFDAVFNVRGEINIIIDAKEAGKQPVFGQTITYINMSKAIQAGGTPSYVIWVEHSPNDADIKLADCIVSLVWHRDKWIKKEDIIKLYGEALTYRQFQDLLMHRHDVKPYDPKIHKFDKKQYLPT
jgi:hypothetical protein